LAGCGALHIAAKHAGIESPGHEGFGTAAMDAMDWTVMFLVSGAAYALLIAAALWVFELGYRTK
jgi:hypothetical protein